MLDYLQYIMNPDSNGAIMSPKARSRRVDELPQHPASVNQEQCSICLDISAGDSVTALFCGHVFHFGCIKRWLSVHEECPLCKQPAFGPTPAIPE
jgi:hypothetical protein